MKYVKFKVGTEYCGTENVIFLAYDDDTPEKLIEEEFSEQVRQNAENYEYLVTGWEDEYFDDEEEKEQALEWYYSEADSYSNWEYITEEEYKEGTE